MLQATPVGRLLVQPFLDGVAILTPAMFTIGESPADWTNHAHGIDPDGKIRVPVGAFLVHTGGKLVLLDAGIGEVDDPMFEGHALLDNLREAGIDPHEIDIVVVSHLHTDHFGWLERNGEITFKNATVFIGKADWRHFVEDAKGGAARAARLRVIESQVELIEGDGQTIASGVTTRATPGHTPGHTSTVISSGDERLIVLGDVMHCPAQLTETEWQFLYDVDKGLASRTREAMRREAEDPNTRLLPSHFPGMSSSRLLAGQGERRWVFGG